MRSIGILHDIIGMALMPDSSDGSKHRPGSENRDTQYHDRQERWNRAEDIRKDLSPQDREELRQRAEALIPEATRAIVRPDSTAYAKMIDAHELEILADEFDSDRE